MSTQVDLKRPLLFHSNRVWRCYKGGELLDRFIGADAEADGSFPEDWLASTTLAMNGDNQQSADEGLSRIRLPDGTDGPLLRDLVEADPEGCLGPGADPKAGMGVLCKFLDAAIRLPIQCHPDRAFARAHYNSEHGKAEAWFILGGRTIDGVEPYLLAGFKPGVTEQVFRSAVEAQDMATLVEMLHRVPVRPGDAFFIPGRFPHAIGSGVFLLEVQEPTDWVVQPERFVGDQELTESDMWGPLTPEQGFACFEYNGAAPLEGILDRIRLKAEPVSRADGGVVENLVGPSVTDCFRVDRLTINSEMTYMPEAPFHFAIVVEGKGWIDAGGARRPVQRGDTLLLSHRVDQARYYAEKGPLRIFVITSGSV